MTKDAQIVASTADASGDTSACAHHWVLESPSGSVSRGRCRVCGTTKEFRNSTPDHVWEEERRSAVRYWSLGKSER